MPAESALGRNLLPVYSANDWSVFETPDIKALPPWAQHFSLLYCFEVT
jgi:hypothetical protein